jgi:hypothetical protein
MPGGGWSLAICIGSMTPVGRPGCPNTRALLRYLPYSRAAAKCCGRMPTPHSNVGLPQPVRGKRLRSCHRTIGGGSSGGGPGRGPKRALPTMMTSGKWAQPSQCLSPPRGLPREGGRGRRIDASGAGRPYERARAFGLPLKAYPPHGPWVSMSPGCAHRVDEAFVRTRERAAQGAPWLISDAFLRDSWSTRHALPLPSSGSFGGKG